jgi:hypothetical protein
MRDATSAPSCQNSRLPEHKRSVRLLGAWVACVVFGGCTVKSSVAEVKWVDPTSVSLIQLIATPEKYEGRRVRVEGFCRFVHEEQSVYLHREDAELLNTDNGVWLHVKQREDVNGVFVRVEGTFTRQNRGHLDAWPGALVEITKLERIEKRPI